MEYGDLVYIPQDVLLFDKNNIFMEKTKKPIVGVLLEEIPAGSSWMGGNYIVYVHGRKSAVAIKNTYPLEESC